MVISRKVCSIAILLLALCAQASAENLPKGCFRSEANPTECWTPSDNVVNYDSELGFVNLAGLFGNAMANVIFDNYLQEEQCSKDLTIAKAEIDAVLAKQGQIISGFIADYDRISGNLDKALRKNRSLKARLRKLKKSRRS